MIKVLYIHHNGSAGGSSNSLIYMLEALPKDVEKYIITPKGKVVEKFKKITNNVYVIENGMKPVEFASIEGVKYMWPRIIWKYFKNRNSSIVIKEKILEINPDIIHLNDSNLIFLARMAKRLGFPVIIHARTAMSKRNILINAINEKYIMKYSDKVLAITGSVKNRFQRVKNIDIIYNTYPMSRKKEFRPRKTTEFNCLFLANLYPFKGIYETIEAAKILNNSYPNIKFWIAGANVKPDDYFKTFEGKVLNYLGLYPNVKVELNRYIKRYNLNNVKLLGFVKNIDELFLSSHVLLTPTHLNAPPRNVFEAGLHGIPSIIAYQDKIEDVVEDGFNGIIIEEKNAQALADAIIRLESNEFERKELGDNSIIRFTKMNNPVFQADKVYKVYQEILSNHF